MRVVFATGNAHKAQELGALLHSTGIQLQSFREATGQGFELEETGTTFEANALLKARHACKLTGLPALGDDSGLEVSALDGAPGLYSARYAGPNATDSDNNQRLLQELARVGAAEPHAARFVCVLALVFPNDAQEPIVVRGECAGAIVAERRGLGGFGYDPLFVPEGEARRMAELSEAEKNLISHRGRAARALCAALGAP